MSSLPALFVSHGAPTMAIEDTPTRRFLEGLGREFEKPKAIVAVSSHWSAATPVIGGAPTPKTLHDFHGFPQELYGIDYPAQGNLELAKRVQALLKDRGVEAALDSQRGLDHAVWTPLRLMYPSADIPVVPLAVLPGESGAFHYRMGEALRPLRDEGVLILASGGITHNLREYMIRQPDSEIASWAAAFSDWVLEQFTSRHDGALMEWETAPQARRNHPTPEHFLPFLVALGAATPNLPARCLHRAFGWGVLALDAYAFD
ncbi:Extradiol ring-cleavage dioxygenase class III protein subunit B [Rhodospirillaceae bacterium LM-1]|nr:Extradiol ring-cleavage dioxygenase class III protein subunit B [Rhodospirillaceae bacterium LM-1]